MDDRDPPWIKARIKNLIYDKKMLNKNIFEVLEEFKQLQSKF